MPTKPIIGYVTVGGARKEISGGYVNIGGVWKPIVKTYVNVNGVWKNAWKDLYTWKKYTVSTTTVYAQSKSSIKKDKNCDVTTKIMYASAYTFDTSTGIFTLTRSSSGTIAKLTSTKKYYMTGGSSSTSVVREFSSLSDDTSGYTLTYYLYTAKSSDKQVQGTYIEDVTSENASAYPTNGVHTDGYWYVKQ